MKTYVITLSCSQQMPYPNASYPYGHGAPPMEGISQAYPQYHQPAQQPAAPPPVSSSAAATPPTPVTSSTPAPAAPPAQQMSAFMGYPPHVQQPGQPGTNQAYPRPPMGMPNSNPYGMGGAGPRGPSPGLYRYPQAPGYQ